MKIVAIVQARMGSTRLPGKVMKKINGTPLIELLLERLSKTESLDSIVLATSHQPENLALIRHVQEKGFQVEMGDENDVLKRYLRAANKHDTDIVVRITGDCPLVDSKLVDAVIEKYKSGNYDYVSNINPRSYPKGLDIEVFSVQALQIAFDMATDPFEREHVTPYIRAGLQFTQDNLRHKNDYSDRRWTVDELSDFIVIEKVFAHFYPDIHFHWEDVLYLEKIKPEIFEFNRHLRNED